MQYYIVDAFTSEAFGGNPAGVVLLPKGDQFPSERLMQLVAAELRYSETVFVQQNGAAEFTVRYFTPKSEVDLCGHATIATFGVLRQEGIVPTGTSCLNHTLAGDLEVRVNDSVMMQMATPQLVQREVDVERLCRIMECPAEVLRPVEIISTGLPDIILPVDSMETLQALNPDMEALTELSRELEVVGVHAFAPADDQYTAHARNFAPLYGVNEESATGTANAALTHYLQRQGLIAPGNRFTFMQGEKMGRPSVVETTLTADGQIYVGGQCCIIAKGQLLLRGLEN
ncbi:MAG: PhzF family phenazine biosynthesis protein [Bacteroidales bacterium]|nr:PhzF family phenazine biosynthesis protein [Bacteroidales bacterium]